MSGEAGTSAPVVRVGKVLIIENDYTLQHALALVLHHYGWATILADSAEEGLAKASMLRPDLIICEMETPQLGGLDTLRLVRRETALRCVPIILMIDPEDSRAGQALLSGAQAVLIKPFESDALMKEVERITWSSFGGCPFGC